MAEDSSELLRLMLQELKAVNLRLDRVIDKLEAVRGELKTEWRASGKRTEAVRSELHADLSVLRGELGQLRGLLSSRDELTPPSPEEPKPRPPVKRRRRKAPPRPKRSAPRA
ncbi:MAG: hypothetical protein IT186_01390 [Acidobacteria bacterium]|nr:hypothetical protein [Acidobacteriota bacterium]